VPHQATKKKGIQSSKLLTHYNKFKLSFKSLKEWQRRQGEKKGKGIRKHEARMWLGRSKEKVGRLKGR